MNGTNNDDGLAGEVRGTTPSQYTDVTDKLSAD